MLDTAGAPAPRRLFVYNAGFLTQPRVRRILALAGWDVRIGVPGPGDAVGVWGQSPTSPRGETVAAATETPIVRVEDAYLRSLFPGRAGEPTHGLLIDGTGVHFDARQPSDLETLLATHPLDDPTLLARARSGIDAMAGAHLSKFAATDPDLPLPDPGYVLVIDQTRGDAAVTASEADETTFRSMLDAARADHPGAPVILKTHPETEQGHRPGHFDLENLAEGVRLVTEPVSPWRLFANARTIHTVSSGLGLEAIFAGHRPVVHGTPFYAGWGLTDDRRPIAKRSRRLTRAQLFAGAMILYPKWYDPYRDQLCEFEDVIRALEAQTRAWREDRHGWTASAMSRWKHPHLRAFFGTHGQVAFNEVPDPSRRHMVWASKAPEKTNAVRVEDGFLRSRGLGARLTPPLSLIADDIGIYYDPRNESRLERLIAESVDLQPEEIERSGDLISRIRMLGLSKYNISAAPTPDLPSGRRRLVVGQVEDDASVLFGAGSISTNAALLKRANSEAAEIVVVYKPHPDVEAGLRTGGFFPPNGVLVANNTDPHALLEAVDEVWTMTSLMGFEALLRGIPVTVTGAPFYAGWGLTRDLGEIPARRTARPSLEGLVHATLIGYPRYRDPVTGQPCPVEVIVDRLATGDIPGPDPGNRILSAFQTLWATLRPR